MSAQSYNITVETPGAIHEYAGEGRWVVEGGLTFPSLEEAEQRLKDDALLINPRTRALARVGQVG